MVIAWLTTYDYWLLLRNFAPVLAWNFYGDRLTDHVWLLVFAAKLCTSSGVKLLWWSPDWPRMTTGFCCETLHQFWCETFPVIAWLTTYDYWFFAAKLCTSSGVKLLRWSLDWSRMTIAFCCKTLHQFWCETVMAWLTMYDYWLLLRIFVPVLVLNFYGNRLTDHVRLLGFAAKLCPSSGVKLLRWSPDWPRTTIWFLLRNFAPVLVWNCYGDRLTDHVWLLVFAAKLCTSSSVKLLQWSPDWPRTTIGFCCETLHQFWCETVTVIALLTT